MANRRLPEKDRMKILKKEVDIKNKKLKNISELIGIDKLKYDLENMITYIYNTKYDINKYGESITLKNKLSNLEKRKIELTAQIDQLKKQDTPISS